MIFQTIAPVDTRPLIPPRLPEIGQWNRRERASVVGAARTALIRGLWDEAEAVLCAAPSEARRDAACLNLQGILHEARHEWRLARRCYGRAMRADGGYPPAEQNLRRLYEMWTFGRTRLAVAIWDLPGIY